MSHCQHSIVGLMTAVRPAKLPYAEKIVDRTYVRPPFYVYLKRWR